MAKSAKTPDTTIAQNKRARFDYHIDESFEAGLVLAGWEVKSLRAGKVQLVDSYVLLKDGEAYLFGAQITPLQSSSTHVVADPQRTRKLLLKNKQLGQIIQAVQADGMTCLCLKLYWKNHLVKAQIALARGKQKHDKRETERERDWVREKARIVRANTKQ
jgi:SsrA-binding protein